MLRGARQFSMSPILAPGGVGDPKAQAGCSSLAERLAKAGGIVAEAECAGIREVRVHLLLRRYKVDKQCPRQTEGRPGHTSGPLFYPLSPLGFREELFSAVRE
jgi:hypothetical protein